MSVPHRLLHLSETLSKTLLSRSSLYAMIKASRFPKPVRLGPGRVAWLEAEVDAWIAERVAERDGA